MKSVWLHIVYEFNLVVIQHNRVANGNCEYASSFNERARDSIPQDLAHTYTQSTPCLSKAHVSVLEQNIFVL